MPLDTRGDYYDGTKITGPREPSDTASATASITGANSASANSAPTPSSVRLSG